MLTNKENVLTKNKVQLSCWIASVKYFLDNPDGWYIEEASLEANLIVPELKFIMRYTSWKNTNERYRCFQTANFAQTCKATPDNGRVNYGYIFFANTV